MTIRGLTILVEQRFLALIVGLDLTSLARENVGLNKPFPRPSTITDSAIVLSANAASLCHIQCCEV